MMDFDKMDKKDGDEKKEAMFGLKMDQYAKKMVGNSVCVTDECSLQSCIDCIVFASAIHFILLDYLITVVLHYSLIANASLSFVQHSINFNQSIIHVSSGHAATGRTAAIRWSAAATTTAVRFQSLEQLQRVDRPGDFASPRGPGDVQG